MKAGAEFLFWLILFAEIGAAIVIHAVLSLIVNYRRALREVARLTIERDRFKTWAFYRSSSPYRLRSPARVKPGLRLVVTP